MGTKPERRRRTPSFFKVLIGDFSVQLRIPIAFVNRFNGELPHKVIIWSPAKRRSWRIDVEKVDNRLAFTNGWTVFVQENSLKFADFLLFRYVGNSKFSVRMYGKDGCEKKLDPPVSRKEKAKQDARAGKDRSLEETRKNSVLSCDEGGRDGNSVPVEANEIGMSNSPRKFRGNEFSLQNTTRETEPKSVITRRRGRRSKVLTEFQVNKALKQASEFTSNFPFFVTVMQSSYLKSGDVVSSFKIATEFTYYLRFPLRV